jgi:hypothetical protein
MRGGPNDEYTETEVTRIVDVGSEGEPQARRSLPLHRGVTGGSCDCRVSRSFRSAWGGVTCRTRNGLGWGLTCRRTLAGAGVGRATGRGSTGFCSGCGWVWTPGCAALTSAVGARKQAPRESGKCSRPAHRPDEALGRSRGGLTTTIHLARKGGLRPLAMLVTPGQWMTPRG